MVRESYQIPIAVRKGMESKGFEVISGKHLCGNTHLIKVKRPVGLHTVTLRYDYHGDTESEG